MLSNLKAHLWSSEIKWIPVNLLFLLHHCMSARFQRSSPSSLYWTCVGESPLPKSVQKIIHQTKFTYQASFKLILKTQTCNVFYSKLENGELISYICIISRPSAHRVVLLWALDPDEWFSVFQDSAPCLWTKPSPSPLPVPADDKILYVSIASLTT